MPVVPLVTTQHPANLAGLLFDGGAHDSPLSPSRNIFESVALFGFCSTGAERASPDEFRSVCNRASKPVTVGPAPILAAERLASTMYFDGSAPAMYHPTFECYAGIVDLVPQPPSNSSQLAP